MTFANLLSITSNPFLSIFIWIVLVLAALYFARRPFHRLVESLCKIIHNMLRLSASAILSSEKRLVRRNREVLIATGQENAERVLDREFDRIHAAVARDLEKYPHLHRHLSELIRKLDDDFRRSADVPPDLPNWLPIIDSIAKIEHTGDSMVANMLSEINRSLNHQHKTAIEAYRNATGARHALLNRMMPHWRQLQKALDKIYRSVENISRRSKAIDHSMQEYQNIRAQTDAAEKALAASSTTQFFVSGLFLVVAIAAAMINFHLIAAPMSGLIGSAATVGPYPTSVIAGLVIILIELSMGLFLMESLRITRLFPIIGALDDKMRQRMIAVTLVLLAGLAGFDAVLTFIGDGTTQSTGVLQDTMAASGESATSMPLIPVIGQMLLAIILPFALAFVAIPLETFVSSSRTVLGVLAAGCLRLLAFALRLLGNIAYYCGRFVINSYDLIIFPTIWLEGLILGARAKKMTESPEGETLVGEPLNPLDKTMKNQEQQE